MNDGNSSDTNDQITKRRSCLGSMEKSELEALAIAAIREHRRLIVADEAVYEEWTRASSDPAMSSTVLESLQREYTARQEKSAAQQEELSEIIDVLGYVPDVAPDVDK
ncbi:transcriptional repressor TraM [Rhizobium leguminosarum]|uniref:transcriptional repressor TraM n=1 Tax=Rhizobium leguminosarum TaxID=384 RepID=UPI001C906082|nr:transcriptional repressor TraM [Rhizobium leguminosarum]MBY3026579.1 transcriptional regulator [Rhizobium leguminosarum]